MLIQMLDILLPTLAITAIGWVMKRCGVDIEARTVSTLVIMVATPALIFSTLTGLQVPVETIGMMAGAALFCLGLAGGLGILALKLIGGPLRSFLPPLMLPNSGNLGLPLVVLAFGEEGSRLGVAYFFVVALVQHSLGLSIYAGSLRIGALLRQPLIYSVLAVLLVTWFAIPVPQVVLTTTSLLGGMMIPAMLLLLGSSLASLQITDLRPALLVASGRLVIGLISALVVIAVLDLNGAAAGTVFLLATMPTAIVSYVFAERFGRNPGQVAGSVVVSTLLTFACLPALIWAALAISDGAGLNW